MIGLLISNLSIYLASKYKKDKIVSFAFLFVFVLIFLVAALYLYNRTSKNKYWWDNGKEIIYSPSGQKILEAEDKKEGEYFGSITKWNYEGKLESFRRYPHGSKQKPDSAVNFEWDIMRTMRYTFDSVGHTFERENNYDYNPYKGLFLYTTFLIDRTTKHYSEKWWYPETRTLKSNIYTFDSVGNTYRRYIYYKKENKVSSMITNIYKLEYFDKSSDDLY